jgi:hypothetical protein
VTDTATATPTATDSATATATATATTTNPSGPSLTSGDLPESFVGISAWRSALVQSSHSAPGSADGWSAFD